VGFCLDPTTSNAVAVSAWTNGQNQTAVVAGTTVTSNLPVNLRDGDLLIAFFTSTANPTTAWSTPTGWTQAGSQKNMASSIGGRAAVFYKKWSNGDATTVGASGPGGIVHIDVLGVRSNTSASSLVLGNPPSGGFTSGYDSEVTVAGTSITIPRFQVDETARNFRVCFIAMSVAATTITPPTPARNLNNQTARTFIQLQGNVANFSTDIYVSFWSDPAGFDAGTTTWTASGSVKAYSFGIVVKDPNGTGNNNGLESAGAEQAVGDMVVPLYATGLEHIAGITIDTISGAGGGGGIAIY